MITEDYVSFETAKLLKEKGFDEPCRQMWECGPDKKYLFRLQSSCYQNITEKDSCLAPTLQMAMKWLREVHKIFIEISVSIDLNGDYHYRYSVLNKNCEYVRKGYTSFDWNFTDAVEEALKYSLENLV